MPNEYDINQMREDAVRRAREMQSRAHLPPRQETFSRQEGMQQRRNFQQRGAPPPRQAPGHSSEQQNHSEPMAEHTEIPEPQEQRSEIHQTPENQPQKQEHPPGLLESLFQDKERTVILALLILLSEDDSHHDLMFALMFLLM